VAVSQHTPRLEERERKDGEYDGGSEARATPNDLITQTVARRYGGPAPQERIRADYSFDALHHPKILRSPTDRVRFSPLVNNPHSRFPSGIGKYS